MRLQTVSAVCYFVDASNDIFGLRFPLLLPAFTVAATGDVTTCTDVARTRIETAKRRPGSSVTLFMGSDESNQEDVCEPCF